MRKYIALFAAVLLISTTTAGCIDIHLFKRWLVPKDEEVIDYTTNRYNLMNKIFNSKKSDWENPLRGCYLTDVKEKVVWEDE